MDYHRDRFPDHSLVVRDPEGELVAVLPAHAAGDTVGSHHGLSYGGLVIGPRMTSLKCWKPRPSPQPMSGYAMSGYAGQK